MSEPQRYKYLGDRLTDPALRGAQCVAVRRADGKCVRGRNGNMVVRWINGPKVGEWCIVLGRQLRKVPQVLGGAE